MRDDPCFSCALPDCDESSKRCRVRALSNSYDAKHRKGEPHLITNAEREANNRIFKIWQLERYAQAAEGVRPYRRAGSKWGDPSIAHSEGQPGVSVRKLCGEEKGNG